LFYLPSEKNNLVYLCHPFLYIIIVFKIKKTILFMSAFLLFAACSKKQGERPEDFANDTFEFVADRFADIEIMRYRVDGWDDLSLQQKELVYYLSEAARAGRDIIFDQNCKYNLQIRSALDTIVSQYGGDKTCENWQKFIVYAKRFWFSNGMHHHYSNDKFFPECPKEYFGKLMDSTMHLDKAARTQLLDIIYNPKVAPKRLSQDTGKDLVTNSAVNFYEGVTQKEVERYYADLKAADTGADPERPVAYGLASKVVKEDGKVTEVPFTMLYAKQIQKIIYWLQKASEVAENDAQKAHILKLIEFYRTGDLKTWDDYNILWAEDTKSEVDYVNGFIEVYTDPLGQKATWEGLANFKDKVSSERSAIISQNAQWFEDHSPIDDMFKKKSVKGVEAKAIVVAQLGGDCYPATPIGINLPNSNWIRKEHGSKSVTIENLMYAYHKAGMKNGVMQEFYYSDEEINRAERYGYQTDKLQVDLHECLGHGSGQMLYGIEEGALKNYHSVIEEARADLFSLYYIGDPKMVELGLLPDTAAYKACYYKYIVNGKMLQTNRIKLGDNFTEAHMQNRALITNWCIDNDYDGEIFEVETRDGKTYIRIKDYEKLRKLFGKLLAEVQKIKSTGSYEAAKVLVEQYGVKIDKKLHKEVKSRYEKLNVAPYGGFLNPDFIIEKDGETIKDIKISYPTDYIKQMLQYDDSSKK